MPTDLALSSGLRQQVQCMFSHFETWRSNGRCWMSGVGLSRKGRRGRVSRTLPTSAARVGAQIRSKYACMVWRHSSRQPLSTRNAHKPTTLRRMRSWGLADLSRSPGDGCCDSCRAIDSPTPWPHSLSHSLVLADRLSGPSVRLPAGC
ncbi:unnamed protein product [Vitrella brassicaformis CCMP3155]|uniref:Uncharacterized protein n=1 Tax=Vitrella brassicaformis (strain CCMP3155) TaxID=1169540 RepID=A0A0G4EAF9_VITBC|nr:unnamed protein product [Vitrella brassicaformis CCMP3155]|eukprot:CEL92218.1 unnamed protein product [Vitrella brassicaformis CCMP3155]